MFNLNKYINAIKNKGFTIIEVMIVLAIAGLILAVIFIAVPQLQRSTRDYQRKKIAESILVELQDYAHRNGSYPFYEGTGPGKWGDFYNRYTHNYVNDKDPTTGDSVLGDGRTGFASDQSPAQDDAEACTYTGPLAEGEPCTYLEYPPYYVDTGKLQVYFDAKCKGDTPVSAGNNPSGKNSTANVLVIIGLDRPGTYYCVDS